jgi:hypothetical protein
MAPSGAAEEGTALPHRTAVLFLVGGVSYEQAMGLPGMRELADQGGVALMTTKGGRDDGADAGYLTLLNGAPAPPPRRASGLLDALDGHVMICGHAGVVPPASLAACGDPAFGSSTDLSSVDAYLLFDVRSLSIDERGAIHLAEVADAANNWFRLLPENRVMVIVASPTPSAAMDEVGDEVTPLVMAVSAGGEGPGRSLRSDTTRQDGLVANVDVAPTILDFFGIPIPDGMTGSPIRIDGTTDVGHLHQLHLDQRRIRLPFQAGLIVFVSLLTILAIASLTWIALGHRLAPRLSEGIRFLCLCAVALLIPLMAGGLLPRLTLVVVLPFVVISTLGLALAARRAGWPTPMGPFVFLGVAALVFMTVDGLFGWRGLRIPLLGGTMFDGARFYGIPNAFLATLLASALFVACALEPWAGTALLFGAGLFAGFPALGADLGGSATLFLAAGLWWAIRTPGRPISVRLIAAPLAVVVGLVIVVAANRLLPGAPTHIAGFVERSGSRGVWTAFTSRLRVGVGQLGDVPAAWLPMLGLPVILAVSLIAPVPIRGGLSVAGSPWRETLVVLTIAAMASFFVNDTGVAAAAPAFLYAATAMVYPALRWGVDR